MAAVGDHTTFVLDPTSFGSRSETPDSSCASTKDIVASGDAGIDKAKSATVDLVATPLPNPPHHGVAVQLNVDIAVTTSEPEAESDNHSDQGPNELGAGIRSGSDTHLSFSSASPSPDQSSSDGAEAYTGGLSKCTTDSFGTYSLEGLSPLETVVPDELMPDELIVHDYHKQTHRPFRARLDRAHPPYRPPLETVRYRRAVPLTASTAQLVCPVTEHTEDLSQHQVAHLYLPRERLGDGNHSTVFRAPFELRLDPTSGERTRVTVAVKTATVDCVSHGMLHQEAMMYTAFPRTLMEESPEESPEESSGAHAGEATARLNAPRVGQQQGFNGDSDGSRKTSPAVVPKFYGYYLPLDGNGNNMWRTHPDCNEDEPCKTDWPRALLLVEECGEPINYCKHTCEQRHECFGLFKRLHKAGFSQGSPFERNILVQPGPLSKRQEMRSMNTPSFRLIDFGRGLRKEDPVDGPQFARSVRSDRKWAGITLRL